MNEKTNNCMEREQKMVNWSGSHPKGPGPSLLPLCALFQVKGDSNVTVPAAREENQKELQRVSDTGS